MVHMLARLLVLRGKSGERTRRYDHDSCCPRSSKHRCYILFKYSTL